MGFRDLMLKKILCLLFLFFSFVTVAAAAAAMKNAYQAEAKLWPELFGYFDLNFAAMMRIEPKTKAMIKDYRTNSNFKTPEGFEQQKQKAFQLLKELIKALKKICPNGTRGRFSLVEDEWDGRTSTCLDPDVFEAGIYVLGGYIAKFFEKMSEQERIRLDEQEKQKTEADKNEEQVLQASEAWVVQQNQKIVDQKAQVELEKMQAKIKLKASQKTIQMPSGQSATFPF